GVNDNSRVVVLVIKRQRINLAAPALSHHFEIFLWIAPCSHRPYHLGEVGRIDILINDNRPSVPIGDGDHLTREDAGLPGMSVVFLSDAYHVKRPPRTSLVHPYSMDFRHRRFLKAFPERSRTDECALIKMRMRRLVGCGASKNGIVAKHHPLDS